MVCMSDHAHAKSADKSQIQGLCACVPGGGDTRGDEAPRERDANVRRSFLVTAAWCVVDVVCHRAGRFPGNLGRAVIGSRAGGALVAGTRSLRGCVSETGKGVGNRQVRVVFDGPGTVKV